jgi:hypothetical protein
LESEKTTLQAAMLLHHDISTLTTAELINPEFSIEEEPGYPASNALQGLLSQTLWTGIDVTWTADISDGPKFVTSVAVHSVKEEGYGYRLSSVNVLVDDVLCG